LGGRARAHHGGAGDVRLSPGVRLWPSGARRGSNDLGFAADDPSRHPPDPAPAQDGGAAMTGRAAASSRHRRARRWAGGPAVGVFGVVLLVWTLLPVYNMLLISLDAEGDEFTGSLWPDDPSIASFLAVWNQDHWYLEHFWQQFGNSIFLGIATMVL